MHFEVGSTGMKPTTKNTEGVKIYTDLFSFCMLF